MRSPSVRRSCCVPFWGEMGIQQQHCALLSGFEMLAILSPFNNNNAACLTLVALTIQNWKKQWSLMLEMMWPLTSVLTVSMLTTIRTLRSNDATSTIAWISSDYFESLLLPQLERRLKSEFGFFQSLSQLLLPTLSNVGEPAWNWIPTDHIQVQKEK